MKFHPDKIINNAKLTEINAVKTQEINDAWSKVKIYLTDHEKKLKDAA
jgi:hypothetical protein